MRAFTAISALMMFCLFGGNGVAVAQTTGKSAARPADSPVIGQAGDRSDADDIVVTARRGEARVAPEFEFDEDEIAGHGADSIQDLLKRLSPFIDPGGGEPVILINGRPAGFDRSILSYPPEALARLAVLKPEAAALYGAAPGKRVVNLVLKPKFSSIDADVGVNWATSGGQSGNNLGFTRVAISGETRWNILAQYGRGGALFKNARDVAPDAGVFDDIGYVTSPNGGPIDPALVAAGDMVSIAAIPDRALSGKPMLADFASTAGRSHPVDPNAYETLQSSQRSFAVSAGVTRPLGALSVSLNLNATSNRNRGLRGLPMASLIIPADSPWSPFSRDVVLIRPYAGDRALHSDNSSRSLDGSLTLNGAVDGWQGSLAVSYGRNWTDSLLETGIDIARIQQVIDALDPSFNPYGAWNKSLLLENRNRSQGENLTARLSLQKTVANLPAGPLAFSLTADAGRSRAENRQSSGAGAPIRQDVSQEQANDQISLVAPISARSQGQIGPLGDLAVNVTVGGQVMSGTGPQMHYGGGVDWSPFPLVQFQAAIDHAEMAPSFALLNAPTITIVNRIFDYAREVVAEPIWITGGNPDLGRGSRQSLTLSATVRPLGDQKLSLNMSYQKTLARGGFAAFPELTPAIEAAFPDRVTRDAAGQLISVDVRPINIDRNTDAVLSSGVSLRFSGPGRRPNVQANSVFSDPVQFGISLNHQYRLVSETLIRPGVPAIDALGGDSGQSRQSVNLQLAIGRSGMGANINANWSSVAHVGDRSVNPGYAFRIKPPIILNLSTFIDAASLPKRFNSDALTKGLRVSIDIQNLMNGYRHVMLGDGTTPAGFGHDAIDPLGRTMRLTVRKRF